MKRWTLVFIYIIGNCIDLTGGVHSSPEGTQNLANNSDVSQSSAEIGGNVAISANTIKYSEKTVNAEGNVRFSGSGFIAKCDSFEYDLETQNTNAKNVSMKLDHLFFTAKDLQVSGQTIEAEDAQIGVEIKSGIIGPNFCVKKVKLNRESKKGSMQNAKIQIGSIPVFYVPKIEVKSWIRLIDLRGEVGYSSNLGAKAQTRMSYRISPYFSLGGNADYYSKRGILLGPFIKIRKQEENNQINGLLNSGFISDKKGVQCQGDEKNSESKWRRKERWFLDFNYNQHLGEHLDIISSFYWMSDAEIFRDFYSNNNHYIDSDIRDHFVELDYRRDRWIISGLIRPELNAFQSTIQTLPQVRLQKFSEEIADSGVYWDGYLEFSHLYNRKAEIDKKPCVKEFNRVDEYCSLSYPIELSQAWKLNPKVSQRSVFYSNGDYHYLSEIGLDFIGNFFEISETSSNIFNFSVLKHNLRPVIQYRRISSQKNKGGEWQQFFEKKKETGGLDVIDLRDMTNTDELRARHLIRLGIENSWDAKKRKNSPARQIASLNIYQDFCLKRHTFNRKKERGLSDFYIEANFFPRKWLNLVTTTRINLEDQVFRELRLKLTLLSGDAWSCSFFTRILRKEYFQYGFDWTYNLNERSKLTWSVLADGHCGKFLSSRISFATCIHGMWNVDFYLKIKNHSQKKNQFQPGFMVSLLNW